MLVALICSAAGVATAPEKAVVLLPLPTLTALCGGWLWCMAPLELEDGHDHCSLCPGVEHIRGGILGDTGTKLQLYALVYAGWQTAIGGLSLRCLSHTSDGHECAKKKRQVRWFRADKVASFDTLAQERSANTSFALWGSWDRVFFLCGFCYTLWWPSGGIFSVGLCFTISLLDPELSSWDQGRLHGGENP